MKDNEDFDGVWRTIRGQKVFIRKGESLDSAMKRNSKRKQTESSTTKKKLSREEEIKRLEKEKENAEGYLEKMKINTKIRALKAGYDDEKEYLKAKEQERKRAVREYRREKEEQQKEKQKIETEKKIKLEKEIKEAPEEKRKQFEIIQKNNPMQDEYHVGIRSPKDIKTFSEAIKDEESFSWGDFSQEDAQRALKSGEITIYSSYPIRQGIFVSTSKRQAEEYAGGIGKKVYSKKIPLNDVAWINGDEGQFAKIKE